MLTGALIGAIVGLVLVISTALKQKRGGKKVLAALQQGGAQARAALDGYIAPPKGKTSIQRIHELQERFAWLGILGAHEDLEREMAAIAGNVTTIAQIRATGAAALLAHRTEPRDLASLRDTATYVTSEGGALLKLVKAIVNDLATVAAVRDGAPLDIEATKRVYDRATKGGPAVKIVLLRFLARMTEVAGANPTNFQREADEALAKLTP